MGTWGPGLFENDAALDFVGDLRDARTPRARWRLVVEHIRTTTEYTVAACETLAFLLGQGASSELRQFARPGIIADDPTPELVRRAVHQVERMMRQNLGWTTLKAHHQWLAALRDLAHRLRTATIQTPRIHGWSMTPDRARRRR